MTRKFIVFAILLTALVFGVAAVPMQAITNFTNITLSGDLVVGDDATVGDGLTVTGDAGVGDDLTVTDRTTTGFVGYSKSATAVLTFDSTLTPLSSYQPISAAAAIGTASITVLPAGTVLNVVNVGSQTIVFTDTGTLALAGNATVTAGDVLPLMSDGTNWVQTGAVSAN